jgi:hypothetical protein
MKTITEVIQVSLRVVQVILRASARTSCAKRTGLIGFFGAAGALAAAVAASGRERRGRLRGAVLDRRRARTRFPGHDLRGSRLSIGQPESRVTDDI